MKSDKCDEIMVSIICAAYNHEKFIAQALESFLAQETNFAYEVIINEDASTDSTADIIRMYERQYPNIIKPIYQQQNLYSQNISVFDVMIKKTKGKYIATCEGDDFWTDSKKLQRQVDYMEKHPECALCGHPNIIVNQTGEYLRTRCDCEKNSVVDLICNGGYMHFATRLARREVYTSFPECLRKKYYDGVAYIYYAHTIGTLFFDELPMSAWRVNENSVTHTLYLGEEKSKEIVEDYLTFYSSFDRYTNGKYSQALEKRSCEQIADMIRKCRTILTKSDYKKLQRQKGYNLLSIKEKLFIAFKAIL